MSKGKSKIPLAQKAKAVQDLYERMAPGFPWHVQDDEGLIAGFTIPMELKHRLQGAKSPQELCEIVHSYHQGIPYLSPDEARDKYFYEEACKPKGQKLADRQILAKAKREHPEWQYEDTIQWMRQRREKYQEDHNLPKIQKRPYKRS